MVLRMSRLLIVDEQKTLNSRKDLRTNQKCRKLVGSDQQMQRLKETKLREADRTGWLS